jgi:hypothetical protein
VIVEMNKFNLPRRNIQKERRQKRAERRKAKSFAKAPSVDAAEKSSSALSLNVSTSGHSGYLSGKNRAKLTKKWRRAQKEALQSGLVTMHDIEMMAVDEEGATTDEGAVQPSMPKSKKKFSMKKRAKLRSRGVSSAPQVSEPVAAGGEDGMME